MTEILDLPHREAGEDVPEFGNACIRLPDGEGGPMCNIRATGKTERTRSSESVRTLLLFALLA
jgi:hypothetical protein